MNELSTQSANWRYHCFVTCATQQWMDESHANVSFIVTQLTSHSNDSASQNERKWKISDISL